MRRQETSLWHALSTAQPEPSGREPCARSGMQLAMAKLTMTVSAQEGSIVFRPKYLLTIGHFSYHRWKEYFRLNEQPEQGSRDAVATWTKRPGSEFPR